GLRARAAGCAERRDLRAFQLQLFDLLEEIGITRVGTGIAAFDIVDSDLPELLGNPKLVLECKRDFLRLTSISQSRVVDQNVLHRLPWFRCNTRIANCLDFASNTRIGLHSVPTRVPYGASSSRGRSK